MRKILLSLTVTMLVLLVGCTTSVRHASGYEANLQASKKVSVLLPNVEARTVSASNKTERQYDYEYFLEQVVVEAVMPEMRKKGYKVALVSRKEIKDLGISNNVIDLRDDYAVVKNRMYQQKDINKSKAFALKENAGKNAIHIASKTGGDMLMIVDVVENVKTKGAVAKDFAVKVLVGVLGGQTGATYAEDASVVATLIDAKTGQVLWANKTLALTNPSMFGDKEKAEKKKIQHLVSVALKPLPNA